MPRTFHSAPGSNKLRVLWVGDACCPTGFARVTHNVAEHLRKAVDLFVLGVNYRGDPHPFDYPIFPAALGGDIFGVGRIAHIVSANAIDVVIINNDPWIVGAFPAALFKAGITDVPCVGYIPVDGDNMRGAKSLNRLAHCIFYTRHGEEQARRGGFKGPSTVIPHGVDLSIYRPLLQAAARERLGLTWEATKRITDDAFIVMNVNRNQPRKRLDLSIRWFAEWLRETGIEDAWLYLHCQAKGDTGWDLEQLAEHYGVGERLIITARNVPGWNGVDEENMPYIYSAADVALTTTQGEGWGLPIMEGLACGLPAIVPVWSALGEWATSGTLRVPCREHLVTPEDINVVGALPDGPALVAALDRAYRDRTSLRHLSAAARAFTTDPVYGWPRIADQFAEVVSGPLPVPQPPTKGKATP